MAPDKIEIKKDMYKHQLMIADFYKISIGNVKKLVTKFFYTEKYVHHYENLQLYVTLVLKLKKKSLCIRIQSIPAAKTIS